MSILRCDVCGTELQSNLNETGILGRDGKTAVLCTLHHSAIKKISKQARLNWRALSHATIRLNRERPKFEDPDEKWIAWEPLDRLVELYFEVVKEMPEDWPLEEK
jgi:hypothetical protein